MECLSVRARIGSIVSARSGRNLDIYCTMPQRRLTPAISVGAGISRIACTLASPVLHDPLGFCDHGR